MGSGDERACLLAEGDPEQASADDPLHGHEQGSRDRVADRHAEGPERDARDDPDRRDDRREHGIAEIEPRVPEAEHERGRRGMVDRLYGSHHREHLDDRDGGLPCVAEEDGDQLRRGCGDERHRRQHESRERTGRTRQLGTNVCEIFRSSRERREEHAADGHAQELDRQEQQPIRQAVESERLGALELPDEEVVDVP